MPPLVIPPLMKVALGTFGVAAIVHWLAREVRRINDELERMKAATVDGVRREALPTLRRDPRTGDWRVT
jgi:hypothetical protein